MKKLLTMLFVVSIMLAVSSSAFAWTMLDTGVYWRQDSSDLGGSQFDKVTLSWISGAQFASPAMLNYFSFNTWTVTGNALASMATAPAPTNGPIGINFAFQGTSPSATNFYYGAWLDNDLLAMYRVWYPDSGPGNVRLWQAELIENPQWPVVPEPGSMLLLSMGILGLFGLRKKIA